MSRFTNYTTYVYDNMTGLNWKVEPTERMLWREAEEAIPSGWRIPTLDEVQGLLEGQKANLAECNAAFGAGNLPTDWFWVHKFNAAHEEQGAPGAFAAYFVWLGRLPANRRLERALCRYVQTD